MQIIPTLLTLNPISMRKLFSLFFPFLIASCGLMGLFSYIHSASAQQSVSARPTIDSTFSATYTSTTKKNGVDDPNATYYIHLVYSNNGNASMTTTKSRDKSVVLSRWVYLAKENKTYVIQDESKRIIVSTPRPLSEKQLQAAKFIERYENSGNVLSKTELPNIEIETLTDATINVDFNALFGFAHFAEFGILPEGIKGYPLEITKKTKDTETWIWYNLTNYPPLLSKKEAQKAFEIPADYQQVVR